MGRKRVINKKVDIMLLKRVGKNKPIDGKVSVKKGFFRNYLLPQKMAVNFNEEKFNELKQTLKKKVLNTEIESQFKKLDNQYISFVREASGMGNLFGAVKNRDILREINHKFGLELEGKMIQNIAIKSLGIYYINVNLSDDFSSKLKIIVASSEEGINFMLKELEKKSQPVNTEKESEEKDKIKNKNEGGKEKFEIKNKNGDKNVK